MKNKTVIFIEPSGSKANVFDNFMKLPMLGVLYLGTILHNAGYNVKIINENILGRKVSPFELKADFICFSSLTVNAVRTIELASCTRLTWPKAKIFIGGIHASLCPEDFTPIADHVVIGEAEGIILDLMEGKFKEQIVKGLPPANLNDLPLINFSLIEEYEKMQVIPIMTSRGCPFNCNFCTVTKIFGKKFRDQSPMRVIEEIKNTEKYFDFNHIFIYDDNLTANRNRARELMDLIIEGKLNKVFFAQVRTDIARDKFLLELMYKAGFDCFFIGFESIDDTILESFHKGQTRDDIEFSIKTIQDYGIHIHGMFMIGEDHDSIRNIENTVDFVISRGLRTVQFMVLTPYPGTEIYNQIVAERRLLHKNWDYYDGMHIVFRSKSMPPYEVQMAAIRAYNKFYSITRSALEILQHFFNICFDAFVWNFKHSYKYTLKNIFIKIGAKYIVTRFESLNKDYLQYLEELHQEDSGRGNGFVGPVEGQS